MGRTRGNRRQNARGQTADLITAALAAEIRRQTRNRNPAQHAEMLQEAWCHLLSEHGDVCNDVGAAAPYIRSAVRHGIRRYRAVDADMPLVGWEKRVRMLGLRYLLAQIGIYPSPEELADLANGDDDPAAVATRRRQGRWIGHDEAAFLLGHPGPVDADLENVASGWPQPDAYLGYLDILRDLRRLAATHPSAAVRHLASALVLELERNRAEPPPGLLRRVAIKMATKRSAERHIANLRKALARK